MPYFSLVLADLAGEQRLHVELEERVAAAADGEVGREHGHGRRSSGLRSSWPDRPAPTGDRRRPIVARGLRRPTGSSGAAIPRLGGGSRLVALGRGGLVLELADRLRRRCASGRRRAAPVGGDEPEQEDDRLAGDEQQDDREREQDRAEPDRPLPGDAERRQDDRRRRARRAGTGSSRGRGPARRRAARPCTGSGAGRGKSRGGRVRETRGRAPRGRRPDGSTGRNRSGLWRSTVRSGARARLILAGPSGRHDRPTRRPARRRPRFAWHPEPDLIGFGDASSRPALEALGREPGTRRSTTSTTTPSSGRWASPPGTRELRETFFGRDRPARPAAPARPDPVRRAPRRVPRPASPRTSSTPTTRARSATSPRRRWRMSVVGELLAQVTQQGVDVWHAGPLATFVEEEVVRWLCDLVGYERRTSFGLLTSGGVMANFLAMALARDIHLAALRGLTAPPRGAALEGVAGLHVRPDALLDRAGTRRAGLPAGDARRPADRRPTSACTPEPVAEAIARDRTAGLTPIAISAVAGSTNTGSVDLIEELAAVAEREDLWFHIDAAYGAAARLSARDAWRGSPVSSWPTRSPSIPTSGSSRPTTSAASSSATARCSANVRREQPEYYRGGEPTAPAPQHDDHDGHDVPGQLNFYKLGFEGHAALAGAEALDELEARRDERVRPARRRQHRRRRAPRPPLRRERRLRGAAAEPALSVVCFRHLPGPRRRRDLAAARRPPGRAPGRARGLRRRLALDDPAARLDVAPGRHRQHRTRPRPTSTGCSRRSGGWRRISPERLSRDPQRRLEERGPVGLDLVDAPCRARRRRP